MYYYLLVTTPYTQTITDTRHRTMTDILATEKAFLKANQATLAAEHPGKFLLIKGKTVHGAYQTYDEGVIEGTKLFAVGPFLVRSVTSVDDADAPSIPALSVGIPLVVNPSL